MRGRGAHVALYHGVEVYILLQHVVVEHGWCPCPCQNHIIDIMVMSVDTEALQEWRTERKCLISPYMPDAEQERRSVGSVRV